MTDNQLQVWYLQHKIPHNPSTVVDIFGTKEEAIECFIDRLREDEEEMYLMEEEEIQKLADAFRVDNGELRVRVEISHNTDGFEDFYLYYAWVNLPKGFHLILVPETIESQSSVDKPLEARCPICMSLSEHRSTISNDSRQYRCFSCGDFWLHNCSNCDSLQLGMSTGKQCNDCNEFSEVSSD